MFSSIPLPFILSIPSFTSCVCRPIQFSSVQLSSAQSISSTPRVIAVAVASIINRFMIPSPVSARKRKIFHELLVFIFHCVDGVCGFCCRYSSSSAATVSSCSRFLHSLMYVPCSHVPGPISSLSSSFTLK